MVFIQQNQNKKRVSFHHDGSKNSKQKIYSVESLVCNNLKNYYPDYLNKNILNRCMYHFTVVN